MTAGLNIAALARRTGVAPDTLRKWEQRYHILQPARTAGGQRRYSQRDVARVEWLRERLREGYRIGEAASLLGEAPVEPAASPREELRRILDAVEHGDPAEIGALLDQAFALDDLERILTRTVRPLLEAVGELWQRGRVTVAQEHLLSEAVRSRLAHLLADAGGGVRGAAVLACAPGERHELGLMTAAIALRREGWKVAYLGSDTPVADALALAERISARLLGISLAMRERGAALEQALREPRRPADLAIILGGGGATPELAGRVGAAWWGTDPRRAVSALRASPR
ncbi:MAG: MerR family transcriptional regulator, light-induced transcriptional regulator [Actinomycetota bacterium]|jgi:methanogenic corrinoid protein MtbC1